MRPMSIQIPTWLGHPELWRFVGFVSAIVGLVCYALSSSFNHLFGTWNFTKLFLYFVLSAIICLATLFAKVWQHSPSLRFRAHVAFLVLTITSIYSFFYDEAINGKPDAYNLVSCVAFAVMSLSLSRQIHCGFEVDLLYFFLGALIIQLMKINKLLGMVGVCFSYFLIILRSSLVTAPENDYIGLQVQDQNHVTIQVDSQQSNTNNVVLKTQFMASIGELRQRNSVLIKMILENVKEYDEVLNFDSGIELVPDENLVLDALSSGTIDGLHEAAKSAMTFGFEKEFSDAYSHCRREYLEGCLLRLLEVEEVPKTFPDAMIDRWINASKVALKILLPSERRLCDRVFLGLSSAADLCFMEICGEATTQLLNFAFVFANGSSPLSQPCRIFEAVFDLISHFESLFCDNHSVCSVKEAAVAFQNRFREAISAFYTKTRNMIYHNKEYKFDGPIGGVHLITHKAMSHIHYCCKSRKNLEPILQEYLKGSDGAGTWSSFSEEMVSLLEKLERKLRNSYKNYEDPSLRSLFMMNNRRFIQKKIKNMDLGIHLSDEWIRNNTAKIQQNLELFHRNSWNKVLDHLKLENESLRPDVAEESMIERLVLFNTHFTEMCTVQSTWTAVDRQLRDEIISSLENIVLPAYGSFIGRFLDVLATNASRYILYGMFDIESRLKDLFLLNSSLNVSKIELN